MRPAPRLVLLALMGVGATAPAPLARGADAGLTVSLIKMPYRGERNLPDLSDSPDYLEAGGLSKVVEQQGCRLRPTSNVALAGGTEGLRRMEPAGTGQRAARAHRRRRGQGGRLPGGAPRRPLGRRALVGRGHQDKVGEH